MVYADTSLLLSLFLNEPRTRDAWRWINCQPANAILASDWTLTEISSALGVKARMQVIDEATHGQVLGAVRRFAAIRLEITAAESADFRRAGELCDRWQLGLRAGDALHLAIAERRGLRVCTLDRGMYGAAVALELSVETF